MQGELQVVGSEEVEVIDKVAQTCRCIAKTIVEVAPIAEKRVTLVVGEVLTDAVGNSCIVCIGNGEDFLAGGQRVVGAAVGVDFTQDVVRSTSPVNVSKIIRIFANNKGKETVTVCVYAFCLLIYGSAVSRSLQDADTDAYHSVGH